MGLYEEKEVPKVYVGLWDKTVQVLNLNEKKLVHILPALKDCVKTIFVTDKWIFVAGGEPIIHAWDHKLKKTKEYIGHQGWVYVLKVHENLLFSGGDDKTIRVWDIESTTLLDELIGHENGVTQLEIANGELFSGSYDHTIICWDIDEIKQQIEERKEMLEEEILSKEMDSKTKAFKPAPAKKGKTGGSKKSSKKTSPRKGKK